MIEKNIVWQSNKVSYENRCKHNNQKGLTVWFTGLSGAGKSTIAVELEKALFIQGVNSCLLDGDNLRHGINSDLGFTKSDRIENNRRIAEIAKILCNNSIIALVATISPFESIRQKARSIIGADRFVEVYVKATLDDCIKRNTKGFYSKSIENFTGVSSPYEVPVHPNVIIDTEKYSIEECTNQILDYINTIMNF